MAGRFFVHRSFKIHFSHFPFCISTLQGMSVTAELKNVFDSDPESRNYNTQSTFDLLNYRTVLGVMYIWL